MAIKFKIIPASQSLHILPMDTAGGRAFKNDGLANAMFPSRLAHMGDTDERRQYRIKKSRELFGSEGAHVLVAVAADECSDQREEPLDGEEDGDGKGQKVLGYAKWYESVASQMRVMAGASSREEENGLVENGKAEEGDGTVDDGQGGKRGDGVKFPRTMDVGLMQRSHESFVQIREEVLGKDATDVWYLGSLGVDPEYAGQGIASKLVRWGIERAEEQGRSVYIESSPAAAAVYRRAGCEGVKQVKLLEDEDYCVTIFLKRPSRTNELDPIK